MRSKFRPLAAAALLLSACVQAPSQPRPLPPQPDPPAADACGAGALQGLVGQPDTVLQTMRFSQQVRVIRPGMAVTMDFSPERLNIQIDREGRISRVSCG